MSVPVLWLSSAHICLPALILRRLLLQALIFMLRFASSLVCAGTRVAAGTITGNIVFANSSRFQSSMRDWSPSLTNATWVPSGDNRPWQFGNWLGVAQLVASHRATAP